MDMIKTPTLFDVVKSNGGPNWEYFWHFPLEYHFVKKNPILEGIFEYFWLANTRVKFLSKIWQSGKLSKNVIEYLTSFEYGIGGYILERSQIPEFEALTGQVRTIDNTKEEKNNND